MKYRILSSALALLLLLSLVTGCRTTDDLQSETTTDILYDVITTDDLKEENTTDTEPTGETTYPVDPNGLLVKIDDYILYRPTSSTAAINTACNTLNDAVSRATEKKFSTKVDKVKDPSEIDPEAFEVLIGTTNRPESTEAMALLNGLGYVIRRYGNKIVINANSATLLQEAVAVFTEEFVLPTAGYGYFILPEELSVIRDGVKGEALVGSNRESNFKICYSQDLDAVEGPKPEGSSMNNRVDYVVKCANEFHTLITNYFKMECKIGVDSVRPGGTPDSSKPEILVGFTNRPETLTFLSELSPTQYGFGLVGKKIVIAGWSAETTEMALDLFISNLERYLVIDETGDKNLVLLDGEIVTGSCAKWNENIPAYSGGTLSAVMEGLGSCYEIYITQTSVTEYLAYRDTLAASGYTLHQENTIGNNRFATYYNDLTMIHAYYIGNTSSVRIVTENMSECVLPKNEDPYTRLQGAIMTFTMVDLDNEAGNFGNCFVITLEDGSFIVHDGGGDSGDDDITLYNVLKKLNKRKDGKIVIAGWFLSHEHWDHFKNFYDVVMAHLDEITLENIYYNQPAQTIRYNSGNPNEYISGGSMARLAKSTGANLVKLHTGQTVQIRHLTVEVLYTQEDLCPKQIYHFNNGSMVTRFTHGGQTVTILGDIEDVASEIMVEMYDEAALRTDMMTVAHHGSGGTTALYSLFKPTVVLWPTNQAHADNQLKSTTTGYYPDINKALVKQKNVKLVIVADKGHKTITLPMTVSESNVQVWKDR